MAEPWAHSGGHLLEDHLQAVAGAAAELAETLDGGGRSARWAAIAGQWHDLGKYRPGFQRYVRQAGEGENAHIEHRVAGREKTHSAAGALWAMAVPVALLVAVLLGRALAGRGKRSDFNAD